MIDDILRRLAKLSERDLEQTVEALRRVHEHGNATVPESAVYADVIRRIDDYQRALETDCAGPATSQTAKMQGVEETEPIDGLLRARELLLRYPVATRGIAHTLMRAGQRFAETAEGRHWAERLQASLAVERAHLLWDQLTHGLVGEPSEGDTLDPTVLLDALLSEALRPDRERRIGRKISG